MIVARLASNAARATSSGTAEGWPVAVARSQVWVAVSSRLIPASTRPGIGPGPASTTRSSTPGLRHASQGCRAASANCAAGSSPSSNGVRALAGGGSAEPGDDADHVLEEVAHRPFRARRLVAVLVRAHAGDDAVGVVEGLVERVDEFHCCLQSM